VRWPRLVLPLAAADWLEVVEAWGSSHSQLRSALLLGAQAALPLPPPPLVVVVVLFSGAVSMRRSSAENLHGAVQPGMSDTYAAASLAHAVGQAPIPLRSLASDALLHWPMLQAC
jgi:hypothetical protein